MLAWKVTGRTLYYYTTKTWTYIYIYVYKLSKLHTHSNVCQLDVFQIDILWVVMPCSNVAGTNILEVHAASIFKVKMEAAWTSERPQLKISLP
jgi:hypothetical protein